MCVTVLYISFILCAIRLNHAADPQQNPSAFRISAITSKEQQVLPLVSGSDLTLFTFYNLTDAAAGPCNGTCQALNTSHTERIDGEDCKVDIENGIPQMNVIITTVVSDSFIGIWSCTLRTPSAYIPGSMSIQNAVFRVFIKPTGSDPELPTTPSGSLVSVNVPNTQTANVTLEAGQIFESLNITGNFQDYHDYKNCDMTCEVVSKEPVKSKSCTAHTTYILAVLISTTANDEIWNCTVKLKKTLQPSSGHQDQTNVLQSPIYATLHISVKAKENAALGLSKEKILIIAIAVSTIVVLIIVGQTICIIHFKKKANRAQIDKNLTPKNTINEGSSTDRYVKKSGQTESVKGEVDEGIYEALEPTRDEPPPLPPLATLPGTPKPQHLLRSASQSNLFNGTEASTTPRPPRSHQIPGKFNTVARSSSLERIKKRPPQPLPSESDIYEDVATEDVSPMKPKLFDMKTSPSGPSTGPPTNPNRPGPEKLSPGFTNILESLKPPGSNVGKPPIAHKFPAGAKPMGGMPTLPSVISGAKPMGGMPMLRPVTSGAKPVAGMPLLPSMISAANLKPVNKPIPPPPVTERPRHRLPTPPSTSAKPYKPKPPVPLPEPVRVEPEPIPEDFESVLSDDSDDEFKCYDVLPDYNIYGNGAY